MIQITIFSGHEGRLRPDKYFYFTLFAACELIRPTVARTILARRQQAPGTPVHVPRPFFLTLFGGVSLKAPTLAEEFSDFRELINSGLLTLGDWDQVLASVAQPEASCSSFTMFGGFDECELPSENEEIEALALQRHLGVISPGAGQVLQLGIGQRDSQRLATLQRALHTSAA
jgi:hypothetical protein